MRKNPADLDIYDLRDMLQDLIDVALPKVKESLTRCSTKQRAKLFLELVNILIPRMPYEIAELIANRNRVYNPMEYINSQKAKYHT